MQLNLINSKVSDKKNVLNRRLLWFQMCLHVFPMWLPKGIFLIDIIIVLFIVGCTISIAGYYAYVYYQKFPSVLFTVMNNMETLSLGFGKLMSLYYYLFKFDRWYHDISKSNRFKKLELGLIGFKYGTIYCQITMFILMSVVIESVQLWSLIYDDFSIETHSQNWIIIRLVGHVTYRIFILFPLELTMCLYGILCYQYQKILNKMSKQLKDNQNYDLKLCFQNYKVIYINVCDIFNCNFDIWFCMIIIDYRIH